jgi:hypothetical protein
VLCTYVRVRVWAIKCKECRRWFFLCQGCFHGQRYCSAACRGTARRRQCREAQRRYMGQRAGRLRQAAAAAAYRERDRRGGAPGAVFDLRHRSTYRSPAPLAAQRLPAEACCQRCGQVGPVRAWQ